MHTHLGGSSHPSPEAIHRWALKETINSVRNQSSREGVRLADQAHEPPQFDQLTDIRANADPKSRRYASIERAARALHFLGGIGMTTAPVHPDKRQRLQEAFRLERRVAGLLHDSEHSFPNNGSPVLLTPDTKPGFNGAVVVPTSDTTWSAHAVTGRGYHHQMHEFPLSEAPTHFGRQNAQNPITIHAFGLDQSGREQNNVSRKHLDLSVDPEGQLVVNDHSFNQTRFLYVPS